MQEGLVGDVEPVERDDHRRMVCIRDEATFAVHHDRDDESKRLFEIFDTVDM